MDWDIVGMWIAGFVTIVLVVALPAGCTIHRDNMVNKAIERGVDPIVAGCSYGDNSGVTCALAAAKR